MPQGLNFLMSQPGYTLEKKGLGLPCTISTSILLGSLGLVWGLLNPCLDKPLERTGTLDGADSPNGPITSCMTS